MSSAPSYLSKDRHGAYLFRIAIPEKLRHHFSGKHCLRRSLSTYDRRRAEKLARRLAVVCIEGFDILTNTGVPAGALERRKKAKFKIRANESRVKAADAMLEELERELVAVLHKNHPDDSLLDIERLLRVEGFGAMLDALSNKEAHRFRSRKWEIEQRKQDLLEGIEHLKYEVDHLPTIMAMEKAMVRTNEQSKCLEGAGALNNDNAASQCLSNVLSRYIRHKRGNKQNLGDGSIKRYTSAVNDVIFILGDVPVGDVTPEMAEGVRNKLRRLPANRNKKSSWKGKSAEDLVNLDIPQEELLSSNTIADKIDVMKSIFAWLNSEQVVPLNPFKNVHVEVVTQGYAQYTIDDLKDFFSSGLYDPSSSWYKKKTTKPGHLWLFLLAAYTGARAGELNQLRINEDLKLKNGIHYLELQDEDFIRGKTKAAYRRIPIHSQLIQLGLLDYIENARIAGQTRILEDFGLDDKPSNQLTRFFQRYRNSQFQHWKEQKKVLHSFRTTFINAVLNNPGLDSERLLQEVVGHEPQQLGATRDYLRGSPIERLSDTVELARYDGLDLSHLDNNGKLLMRKT